MPGPPRWDRTYVEEVGGEASSGLPRLVEVVGYGAWRRALQPPISQRGSFTGTLLRSTSKVLNIKGMWEEVKASKGYTRVAHRCAQAAMQERRRAAHQMQARQ